MKKRVISPEALKALRERKGWSQEELAQRSMLTARRISSLEKEESDEKEKSDKIAVQQKTFRGLCKALGERPEVLSGEVPLPPQTNPCEVHIKLDPRTRLNLDLLKKKYGFTLDDVINAAPLFLVKAAEATLSDQAQQLAKDIKGVQWDSPFYEYESDFTGRGFLISSGHIFECDMTFSDEDGHEEWNGYTSFAYHLYSECVKHRIGHVFEEGEDLQYFPGDRIPEYLICSDELDGITCGSREAGLALSRGITSIFEIPNDLWEPENSGKRVAWLEEKYDQYVQREREEERDIDPDLPITLM